MPEIDCSSLHPEEASKKFWRSFLERNQSIIVQEFYNINLFIPEDRNRISLEECLRHYVKETDCEYTCEKCRSTKGAKQKVEIIKLPPILIIHLERFLPDEQMLRKEWVRISKEQKDFKNGEFTRGRENKYTTFNLYAVSNHFGSLEGGHYTATCYSKQGRSWYKYDDQDVSQLDDSSVESSAAYILFYSALDANNPLLPLG